MNILLVEDNLSIVKGLIYALEQNNYQVVAKNRISDAIEYLEEHHPDLVILDISLPDGDGTFFYRDYIKDIKTIILSANDNEDDIVSGLEMGADDYITKPFSTRELIARVNKLLRSGSGVIKIKNIEFDTNKMLVKKDGVSVNLSSLELKILMYLFTNINKVVTRQSLIERIWEWTGNDVYDNTVTVYMKRIREKLGTDIIVTLKGIGYRIDNEK